jgi:hypothetical protein
MLGGTETVVGHTQRFRPMPNTHCMYVPHNAVTADCTVIPFARRAAAGG